jgi:hypothetical protein
MSASKTTWKDYLLNNLDLDISNCHLEKIEDLSGDNTDVVDAFKKIQKILALRSSLWILPNHLFNSSTMVT